VTTPATSAITLDRVTKVFPGTAAPAVGDLSLDIPEGEIVAFVGPSGCGKTTTLKMINRLVEPTSGRIEVLGRDQRSFPVHELRRRIGYVIQQIGLFPHRTIAANVGTVPRLLGWDDRRIAARIDELVELVGLDPEVLDRYPSELSGGQQQRVGVARALAADPPILLMDEPYSAVDPIVRARLQDELLALQARVAKTVVLVTHDIDEAIKVGDRVAVFSQGGVLEQFAAPAELLTNPATPFVERFLGGERGLRRLGLSRVRDLVYGLGPVVGPGAELADGRAAADKAGTEFVVVVDGDDLLGWLWTDELAGGTARPQPHPFRAVVSPDTVVREALDVIVMSRTRVAVVVDDEGGYRGMVTVDDIAEGLAT
jgi:osmoprotectant transport system ATP-binding protein